MSVIYSIINLLDNKIYIGSTKDAKQRRFQHFSALKNNKHHSYLLQKAWNKGNPEDFEFKIIEETNSLQEREQFYMDFYKSYDKEFGYNIRKQAYEYTMPKIKKHKIYQFTLEGEYIQCFNSSREAGAKVSCDYSGITKCCNKHKLYYANYIWSYNSEVTKEQVILVNEYIAQKAKERSEISGSTRKLHRQKGTGGSRKGSIKSGTFVGGARIHGPRPRDYSFKLNKKLKQLARKSAFAYKAKENNITVLENFNFDAPKTKQYVALLNNLKLANEKVLMIIPEYNNNIFRSSRNLPKAKVVAAKDVNTYEILHATRVILLENSVPVIVETLN